MEESRRGKRWRERLETRDRQRSGGFRSSLSLVPLTLSYDAAALLVSISSEFFASFLARSWQPGSFPVGRRKRRGVGRSISLVCASLPAE